MTPTRPAVLCSALALFSLAGLAHAQPENCYDFSAITTLAQGAINGLNVPEPVEGFDLLILHRGLPVYHEAFGTWTINQPAQADSATKTLSGALIMSLIEKSPQPFSLDTKLSEYIPPFSGVKQTITIRQCFSHTAGFGFTNPAVADPTITLQDAALQIAASPLVNGPAGTKFAYGGTSMHAAGAVAELAGGEAWNTLFAKRITAPLFMNQTVFTLSGPENPRIAAGCQSTANEFGRFMEMLRNRGRFGSKQILEPASVDEMFTRQTPIGIPIVFSPLEGVADYGVGVWLDQRDAQGKLIGAIAAGARGFHSWIDFDDELVGVFATDLTEFSQIEDLSYLIRDAAQEAIRGKTCCEADCNGSGSLSIDDFICFQTLFALGIDAADCDLDGTLAIDDFICFQTAFAVGC
jgi:CubicO group peptidase (beta-lactamase class C family)